MTRPRHAGPLMLDDVTLIVSDCQSLDLSKHLDEDFQRERVLWTIAI